MPQPLLPLLAALLLLGACAGPRTAEERLADACANGDATSCEAVDQAAAPPDQTSEPEVEPASRGRLANTSVGIGVSGGSSSGVGVGIGIGFGGGHAWDHWR